MYVETFRNGWHSWNSKVNLVHFKIIKNVYIFEFRFYLIIHNNLVQIYSNKAILLEYLKRNTTIYKSKLPQD